MATKHVKEISAEDQEIWRNIPNHLGFQVSNLGRIRSKWIVSRAGGIKRWVRLDHWRIVEQKFNSHGYSRINLKGIRKYLHQVILEVFVGPREKGMVTRHLNGDKTDNRLVNLNWGTIQENAQDNVINGAVSKGQDLPQAKLTEKDVLEIREARKRGVPYEPLSKKYGVSKATICRTVLGRSWNHVK